MDGTNVGNMVYNMSLALPNSTVNIWYDWNTSYFNGILDEFRLYMGRALTTSEIDHFYNSNLSAKANYWEYTVDYKWVSSRPIWNYTYKLFDTDNVGVRDEDFNTSENISGYVLRKWSTSSMVTFLQH